MLGLESVGRNPLDLTRGGHSPVGYLRGHAGELKSPGSLARTILALQGAKVDPRSFGGRNLVEALLKRRRGNGSFEGWPTTTSFAIVALRSAGATGGLNETISWLVNAQGNDGGWGDTPGSPSTADSTSAALEAIPDTEAAQRGLAYLRKHQRPSGGFALGGAGAVNSQSTAWAVQGLLAVGADPGSAKDGNKSALEYLAARQADDGHYRYSSSSDQTPVFVTGQAVAATAGEAFPVTPVARQAPPAPTVPPPSRGPRKRLAAGDAVDPTTGDRNAAGTARIVRRRQLRQHPAGERRRIHGQAARHAPGPRRDPHAPPRPREQGEAGAAPTASKPAAPPFEAGDNPSPSPWIPIGIGLGASALALGSVLFLGRRFAW